MDKHTSKVVAKWLEDNKVKVLEWPFHSSPGESFSKTATPEKRKKLCI
jgi:hypothetical protein